MSDLLHAPTAAPKLSTDSFQRLYENLPVAMLLEDAEGYLRDANAAACALFGNARAGLVGQHASETIPPRMDTRPVGERPRHSILQKADGETLEVTVLSTSIALGLDEGFLISIWEDAPAGERPAAASAAQQPEPASATAPEALAMTRKASCRIAELLNDSLTAVRGFVSLAQDNLGRGVVQSEHLSQIAAAADRGADLARQLLLFGEPRFGTPVELDPQNLLEQLHADLRARAGGGLEPLCADGDLPPILAAPDAVREILNQLLDNARQATGGAACPVGITASLRSVAATGSAASPPAGIYVAISVDDDGPGMSPEVARSAFEPFFGDPHIRSRGLGLSIVRGLMRQVDGHVELESSPDRGTTITLLFPACETVDAVSQQIETTPPQTAPESEGAPEQEEPATPATNSTTAPEPATQDTPKKRPSTTGGKETILIVEDEEMVRDLVKRSLGYLGYNVIDACNGEEGLALGRQRSEEIDMVFTDIVMPRMSGPEMVAQMTAEDLGLPVLYTTGFTDNKRLLDNGEIREGVNLLPKPYTTKVLAGRIREVLDAAAD